MGRPMSVLWVRLLALGPRGKMHTILPWFTCSENRQQKGNYEGMAILSKVIFSYGGYRNILDDYSNS